MTNLFKYIVYTTILIFPLHLEAQKSKITLDDVFNKKLFSHKVIKTFNWMNNSKYYTALRDNKIVKFNTNSGEQEQVLFDGDKLKLKIDEYSLSGDEKKLLVLTNKEKIYRRSFKAEYVVYNLETNKSINLSNNGPQQYATFSPDGSKVAFVRNNNLFYVDLNKNEEVQITNTGVYNKIINGTTDWVYEEEFAFVKAFEWSPNGDKIAYYVFDETKVKEYQMQVWDSLYPGYLSYKYPKAGEANSKVSLKIFHLNDGKNVDINSGGQTDVYIPRMQWTKNNDILSFIRLNRLQNKYEIIHAGANSGMSEIVLLEIYAKNYFDLNFCDDLNYFNNEKQFLYSSEQKGYKHFYIYDYQKKELEAVTKGDYEVDELIGIDEKSKTIYFTSTEDSHLERQLYKIGFNGKGKTRLTTGEGWHDIDMSTDTEFYIDTWSAPGIPPQYSFYESSGKKVKTMEDNSSLKKFVSAYEWNNKEFTTLSFGDTLELYGYIIKPEDFDPNKKYPLMMFLYGGPGNQKVTKEWDGSSRELYHKVLAQNGYIVACFDNRGTGGRGANFKKQTYLKLGKLETEDQINIAKKLCEESYIDANRIGIWGWSYGGFMSSSVVFKAKGDFKLGIAVAPVSNWRYYDNIYTERYMAKPQENASGYDDNSPINFAELLSDKTKFLLIHGTGDDNVHFQNSVELQRKLIQLGKQFDSFYYPDQDHHIKEPGMQYHIYTLMFNYILENL